ncbi:MAG TPA: phenylalanine--tRNA ligase subunit beta [Prolixibacteraceae bacterium]|jgi:phenylalanyl-tRNA synthetase beta chain|nr:phenylalanine--tRNA ligase subunit beta [Prolixibacteraceae bacterium]HRV90498.1 phenylalanine--tRNA ligase subunit beta [Prolixibacteraceae bacterium]
MKLSYNWLKSYIDLEMTPSELCRVLTGIGLEVGGMEEVESIRGGLAGLVIGEVLTCAPHPNSDHLSKTTVSVGSGAPLPIICGAPNVAAGQKVVVAPVGTTLYPGGETLTIKKAKIRGEISEGMICSEVETGLGSDGDGIMVLPAHARVGMNASDYFHIESDWVIEIDITPNRIDSASHLGVARDLAAFFRMEQGYRKPAVDAFAADNHQLEIPVTVANPEACPRYSGVTLTGVEVKESPAWLQNRLKAIGLSPINNIVDITNFVQFETNQPLHAFDADEIKGGEVIVRTLPAGTRFTTLDGAERTLESSDLMICNAEEGMCIAGVFGGIRSGVKHTTTNLFLESACFDPVYIRKTARRHGLYTDASFRFERGTDINGTLYALKRAALMIKEIAGGTISSAIADIYPEPVKGFPVEVTWHNITRLIGKELGKETIRNILTAMEFSIEQETERGLSLMVPTYRVDVKRECDVIEEILRIYGYNNVEIPTHVNASLNYSEHPGPELMRNTIAEQLVAQGFHEIWSNSLTKASYYENTNDFPAQDTVKIFNPLSNDLNSMRQTLLFGGLEAIARNANRKNIDLRLFEFGNCYHLRGTQYKEDPVANYREEEHLALFLTGNRENPNWLTGESPSTFYLLKSYAENILTRLGFDPQAMEIRETQGDLFSEGIGYHLGSLLFLQLGMVSPTLLKETGVEAPVFYADFDWSLVMTEQKKNSVKYTELPRYPEVRRDLALVLDKPVRFSALRDLAFKTERHLLKAVSLFDVYEGKGVPEGKKSYAMSFILRDDNKTLNDKVIDKTMEKLLQAFEKETGARLR